MRLYTTRQTSRCPWLFIAASSIMFLSLNVCLHAQSAGFTACLKARTCTECIKTDPLCAWCKQEDFQETDNHPRCDNPDVLRERGCLEGNIENPLSTIAVEKKTPLSKAGDPLEELVQVYPQEIHLEMRPGEKVPITLQIRQAEDYPVDLYYLMDLSDSMSDDLVQLRSLGGILAAEMNNITRDFRLGYGAFIDKTVMPYIDISPEKLLNPCLNKKCGPAFSFHNVLPLTIETDQFTESVSRVSSSGNLDSPEGGMDALMQATVCTEEIGWRKRARHLLVYTTDASFHIAGDGKLGGIVKPNDGKCHMGEMGFSYDKADEMDYPSISKLSAKVQEHDILPIFAIGKAGPDKQDPFVFYEDLPQYFREAKAARLSADSSNIVDLVKSIYLNITSEVRIEDNADPEYFNVTYSALCLDGNVNKSSQQCGGLKLGDNVTFLIEITMNNKSCEETNLEIEISPTSFDEKLTLKIKPKCNCNCSEDVVENDPRCSGHGTYVCGACICNEGRSGKNCECDRAEAEGLDPACVAPFSNATVECLGRGTCVCGICECNSGNDAAHIISGGYCQCDNQQCRRSGGAICGGPEQGQCECNKKTGKNYCVCSENYEGEGCECPKDNQTCRAASGEICNGVGECVCGTCVCFDPKKYSGATCQICPDCQGECEINQPCVQCRAFHSGPFNKSECKNCPHPIYVVKELRRDPGHEECRFTDDDECYVIFTYERLANGTYYIEVQEEKICPGAAEMLWVILGIIIGIILVGLALLLIWRLLTYIHDRREFQNFEKERANATWEAGENPIYKPSTSHFKNPTYNIK